MGIFDTLLGNDSADAAKAAAADTYAKQQAAVSGIQQAGGQYATDYKNLAGSFQPYQAAGTSSLEALLGGLGLNGQSGQDAVTAAFRASPGYQYSVDQSLQGINRQGSVGGQGLNGNTLAALSDRAGSMADQEYQTWLGNLSGVANMGQNATNQYVNTVGTGLTGQLGANTSAFNGQMADAGTIGQGDVAAAQAKSSALTNLLQMGTYLGGAALSGGTSLLGGVKNLNLGKSLMGGGTASGYGAA